MANITTNIYGQGLGGLLSNQQQAGVQQAYGNMLATYTTTGATSACWIGYQDMIKAVTPDSMEVGIDPRAWLRQRIKEIEWRA